MPARRPQTMDCDWEVPASYCTVCKRPLSSHRRGRSCSGEIATVVQPDKNDGPRAITTTLSFRGLNTRSRQSRVLPVINRLTYQAARFISSLTYSKPQSSCARPYGLKTVPAWYCAGYASVIAKWWTWLRRCAAAIRRSFGGGRPASPGGQQQARRPEPAQGWRQRPPSRRE